MKKFLALLLALTMALALVACGGGDDAASDTTADSGDDAAASTGEFEEMTWKFACSATETSPWVDGAKEFARIVGEKTGGAITPEEKRLGVSLLLINTAKGAQVFDSLPLHRRRCGLAGAVAADRALRSPTPVSVDRSRFFDALEQEPFRQVCARFLSALQPREAAGKPLKELLGNVRLPFGKRKQK